MDRGKRGKIYKKIGNAPRCKWCGKYTKEYKIHQPYTESWKIEPNDPELLCLRCNNLAINSEINKYI